MKKYRVTNKHEVLKEGIVFGNEETIWKNIGIWCDGSRIKIGFVSVDKWLKYGWIEEIQELEFNKKIHQTPWLKQRNENID